MRLKQTKIYLDNKLIIDEPRIIEAQEISSILLEYKAHVMHVLHRHTSEYSGLENIRKEILEYKMEVNKCR